MSKLPRVIDSGQSFDINAYKNSKAQYQYEELVPRTAAFLHSLPYKDRANALLFLEQNQWQNQRIKAAEILSSRKRDGIVLIYPASGKTIHINP